MNRGPEKEKQPGASGFFGKQAPSPFLLGDDSGHEKYLRLILEKEYEDEHRLIMEKPAIEILKYIRDNQLKNSITKGQVVRHMEENEICSRLTTLKLIQRLLDHKILLNDRKRDNTYSSLTINPLFDFKEIEMALIMHCIKGIKKHFLDFDDEARGANTVLIDELLRTLDKFTEKEDKDIYRSRQRRIEPPTTTKARRK